jgi:CBS domain-containing protein
MDTEVRNSEATHGRKHRLTHVASSFSVTHMVRYKDIEKRLGQQYNSDVKSLKQNYARQNELLGYVIEFRDLEREAKSREDRARRVIELLGDEEFADTRKEMLNGVDVSKEVVITTSDESPLWEAMQTLLEQTGELQVVDLQDTLLHFGRKVTRQAIESALGSHKEAFHTVVRNRDKFVSLKR